MFLLLVIMSDSKEDQLLVRAILSGDISAFSTLYNKYEGCIYRLMLKMCGNPNTAEDLAHDAFVKMYENLDRYDAHYKFFSWFYRLSMNLAINAGKRKREITDHDNYYEPVDDSNPVIVLEQNELNINMNRLIAKLDSKYRSVIVLKYTQQLSYAEMSDILNIPEKKVKSRLYSAREILRTHIQRSGFYEE